jgi:serine/threonine-protein kinase HipA
VAIDERQRGETLDSYRAVAREAGIAGRVALAAVRAAVEQAQDLWPNALRDMNAPPAVADEIHMRLKTLPLARLK